MNINDTFEKRYNIPVLFLFRENNLMMPVRKKRWQQTVSKGLRKMDMVVDELHFRSHVYRW